MGFKGPSPPLDSYCPAKPRTPETIGSLGNRQSELVDVPRDKEHGDLLAQTADLVRDTANEILAFCLFGALFNWDHRPVRKSIPASCKSKPYSPNVSKI